MMFGLFGLCDGLLSYHEPLRFYMYTIYPSFMRWHDKLPPRDVFEIRTDLFTMRKKVHEMLNGTLEERQRKELLDMQDRLAKLQDFDSRDSQFRKEIEKIQSEMEAIYVETKKEMRRMERESMVEAKEVDKKEEKS
jgi:hypothetical protein